MGKWRVLEEQLKEFGNWSILLPLSGGHSSLGGWGAPATEWLPAPRMRAQCTDPPQLTGCALVTLKGTYLHVKTGLISLTKKGGARSVVNSDVVGGFQKFWLSATDQFALQRLFTFHSSFSKCSLAQYFTGEYLSIFLTTYCHRFAQLVSN